MEGFLDAAGARSLLQSGAELVCAGLDHVPFGVVVLDARGERVASNRCLRDWARDSGLATSIAEEDPALIAAVDRALDGASSRLSLSQVPLAGRLGSWRVAVTPFPFGPDILGAVLTIEDSSEQHRTTQALEASQRRLRGLVDSASDGIASYRDGVLLYVNPAGARMLGFDDEETLVGRRLFDFVQPEDPSQFENRITRGLGAGPSILVEATFIRRDRTTFPVEVAISSTPAEDGLTTFVFFRDITEQRRMRADLERAQRMESLGQLAGGIAHDFNNLITAIAASLQLARRSEGARLQEALDRAEAAALRASDVTRQLLTFSRGSTAERESVDPNPIVEEVVDLLKTMKGTRVQVSTQLDLDVGKVWIGSSQLYQVIFNLLINAWDAIDDTGEVAIMTAADGDQIRISVSDTGVGMDAATRERVFEPFFTTKPSGQGTGLGLSTAYGIVTHAGGAIDVESVPGEGTTMHVFLSRSAENRDGAPPERPESSSESPARDSDRRGVDEVTILICDDEVRLAMLTAGLLEPHGYRVLTADSAGEALEVLGRETVDVLVLDVHLKPTPAAQLLPEIAEIDTELNVILSSGYSREDIASELLEHPLVAGYLAKPYPIEDLVEMIRGVLRPSAVRPAPQ